MHLWQIFIGQGVFGGWGNVCCVSWDFFVGGLLFQGWVGGEVAGDFRGILGNFLVWSIKPLLTLLLSRKSENTEKKGCGLIFLSTDHQFKTESQGCFKFFLINLLLLL